MSQPRFRRWTSQSARVLRRQGAGCRVPIWAYHRRSTLCAVIWTHWWRRGRSGSRCRTSHAAPSKPIRRRRDGKEGDRFILALDHRLITLAFQPVLCIVCTSQHSFITTTIGAGICACRTNPCAVSCYLPVYHCSPTRKAAGLNPVSCTKKARACVMQARAFVAVWNWPRRGPLVQGALQGPFCRALRPLVTPASGSRCRSGRSRRWAARPASCGSRPAADSTAVPGWWPPR